MRTGFFLREKCAEDVHLGFSTELVEDTVSIPRSGYREQVVRMESEGLGPRVLPLLCADPSFNALHSGTDASAWTVGSGITQSPADTL